MNIVNEDGTERVPKSTTPIVEPQPRTERAEITHELYIYNNPELIYFYYHKVKAVSLLVEMKYYGASDTQYFGINIDKDGLDDVKELLGELSYKIEERG